MQNQVQTDETLQTLLASAPVLPVLAVDDAGTAVALAETLRDAGLPVIEITLRTDAALDAIRRITDQVDGVTVGAGTVLDGAGLAAVEAAGAAFAIAPGCTERLYRDAARAGLPFLPAIQTPGELMLGLEHGHRCFKFFPAEAGGGIGALRAFAGPFGQVRFCPTGGLHAGNAGDYLALPNVVTVGGSWMVPAEALRAADFARIAALSADAARLAADVQDGHG